MAYKKKKNWLSPERREPGGFAALPHCLLASSVFIGLSPHAIKLLTDLLIQFKGFNNGDLCMAWTIMEKRGWKSRDTLNKARLELLDKELILVSRHGDRKRPTLYALTFFAIDECRGKLDVKATAKPVSTWRLHEPLPPLSTKNSHPVHVLKDGDLTQPPSDRTAKGAEYVTPPVSNQQI